MKPFNQTGCEYLIKAKQENIRKYLAENLPKKFGKGNVTVTNDYIFCKGQIPMMFVCHMDTVHKEIVKDLYVTYAVGSQDNFYLSSPQGIGGDDRCGVYAAIYLINNCDKLPYFLFTTNEEIGCIGAKKAMKDLKNEIIKDKTRCLKYMVEFDRKGEKQVVYYDTTNKDFMKYVESFGFERNQGSSSDVRHLSNEWGIASCNVSSGYYDEHQIKESVCPKHMMAQIQRVMKMVKDIDKAEFFTNK